MAQFNDQSRKQMEDPQQKHKVIILLINHMGLTFTSFEHKEKVVNEFKAMSYTQLIRPLVLRDRRNHLSYGQLAIKYQCSVKAIRYILENCEDSSGHAVSDSGTF